DLPSDLVAQAVSPAFDHQNRGGAGPGPPGRGRGWDIRAPAVLYYLASGDLENTRMNVDVLTPAPLVLSTPLGRTSRSVCVSVSVRVLPSDESEKCCISSNSKLTSFFR